MNLRSLRKKKNMLQQELADEIKCHVKTIQRYENGYKIPYYRVQQLEKVLK